MELHHGGKKCCYVAQFAGINYRKTRTRKYSRCTMWRARLRVKGRKNKRCLNDVTEKYLGASHLREQGFLINHHLESSKLRKESISIQ